MISPAGMAIAAITIMLWIVWSDTMRARRSSQMLYAMRIALYLVVSGVFILNMILYPRMFTGTTRGLCVAAVVVAFIGVAYFTRRLVRRA